jgi:hypothetical protein
MATLVLQAAGSAIGGAIGGPAGAMLGRAIGGIAGAVIDSSLVGGSGSGGGRQIEGPRLKEMNGLSSTEGDPIPRVYGRAKLGGQLIWATRFEEQVTTTVERSGKRGGKGFGGRAGGQAAAATTKTSYSYYANLAVAICEGPIAFIRRIWADGREVDCTTINMRRYHGTGGEQPDPLILAKEGWAPGYRDVAYVVFERLPLEDFGNRIPQFSFEVVKRVPGATDLVRAVTLIPGATEFGYDPAPRSQTLSPGVTRPENRHQLQRESDLQSSLDHMQALMPNLRRVSLVVSWFGSDLRAGVCRIEPRVESNTKLVEGLDWAVAGLVRGNAVPVSRVNGNPAYGGTPSDVTVITIIQALKARGLEVVFYPFIMMDVPAGNGLPDPYGRAEQPPYPWRGRVTCHPAAGQAGSVDGTASAEAQVTALVGTVQPGEISFDGTSVICAKPDEWSFRRLILHCARLAEAAGGVSAFVIGSELIGLTRVRGLNASYPMVQALVALAADVRAILGSGTKLTYAADWTEYGAHVLGGGSEVRFPLDPLWASANIDAVGIDWYPPISDWRDGPENADASTARNATDLAYLRNGLVSGEAFDWYYPDAAARADQNRVAITDGAYGKPWIYRAKDLPNWWLNPHHERVGGAELASATAWVPGSKPIWITEIGFPAVDKSGNGPNVFPDPKSAESAYPPFSTAGRDDLVQMRALEASLGAFDPASSLFLPAANPVSPVTGLRMVDPANVYVWTWDARPFPAFPDHDEVWADGPNWDTGHWITGRAEGMALERLVEAICTDHGLGLPVISGVDGFLDGYVIDRPMSAREALEPLARTFGFDAVLNGQPVFIGRNGAIAANLDKDDLVPDRDDKPWEIRRVQETELARELRLGFVDGDSEYRRAAVSTRRLSGSARRELAIDSAIVTRRDEAQRLANIRLQESWAARETVTFNLSPRLAALEPGDVIRLPVNAAGRLFRIVRITDGAERAVEARLVEPAIYAAPAGRVQRIAKPAPLLPGKPWLTVLDVPFPVGDPPALQALAVFADPWPNGFVISRSDGEGAPFRRIGSALAPALIGRTLTPLGPGPLWRWDRKSTLDVKFSGDPIASVSELELFSGSNRLAIRGDDGTWEIIGAASAQLIGANTVRLSTMLRGLDGSEALASRNVAAGATIIMLDEALIPVASDLSLLGRTVRYRAGPFDRDSADPSVAEVTALVKGDALRPLSPVHPRARRSTAGIAISWIRRTRSGGDAWEPVDVPLGEDREAYRIDILNGVNVMRSYVTATADALYPPADEIADFGAAQTQLSVLIRQMSLTVGEGAALTRSITIG